MNFNLIKFPIYAAVLSTLYFFLIKEFTRTKNNNILYILIFLQLIVMYFYYKSLQNIHSGILYAIINGLSVILGAFIANYYFKEYFTKYDIIGIILIISGIFIVGRES
jgi:multidrug transporter EmrE-like cation transporter